MTQPPLPLAAIDAVTQITEKFGINLPGILAQMFSFAVVAFVLWRFAFKPILATIDERQKKIDSGLKYADEMKAKLEAAQQSATAQFRDAQLKGQQIVAEAEKAAKEFADRQQKETLAKTSDLIAKAQDAIELEKKKMLADARSEIARLVVTTTQRVLAKELSELERERFNVAAARELTNV
jgi:F-type H+-transporting ATPase subunit b